MTLTDLAEPLNAVAAAAAVALLLALIAVVVALTALRRARVAQGQAHTHTARPERRLRDQGPPAGVPERRGSHAADGDRARRRDHHDPQWTVPPVAPTPDDLTAQIPAQAPNLPRPGQIGRR